NRELKTYLRTPKSVGGSSLGRGASIRSISNATAVFRDGKPQSDRFGRDSKVPNNPLSRLTR
ncbi:unnamed protein product, partial [Ectocarpus sp. 12 AP-2014]